MMKVSIGAGLSALLVAGLLGFGGVGAASAASVMKQCGDDWKAAKAAGTTNGQTWQEFLKSCRAQKEGAAAPPPPRRRQPPPRLRRPRRRPRPSRSSPPLRP